jgi:hypothetical protein
MQDVWYQVFQPASAGQGRGSVGAVAISAGDDHCHRWEKLPDSVGLFACRERECLWYAVCPAYLGSLDVALRVRDGMEGLSLYWCSAHQGGGTDDGQP